MNTQEQDYCYLKLAYEAAANLSTDPSTQNGVVLVHHNSPQDYLVSANFFPNGVQESKERWERPLKYKIVEHAERNVIYLAAKQGFKTERATMYATWFACCDCARAIIQAGITEVVGHEYPSHKEHTSWKESIEIADKMLEEAGVKFRRVPGHFGIKIRFNGQVVEV